MRVERVERFLSFPLTSGRKEKKKSEFCRRYSWGHSIPELFFLTFPWSSNWLLFDGHTQSFDKKWIHLSHYGNKIKPSFDRNLEEKRKEEPDRRGRERDLSRTFAGAALGRLASYLFRKLGEETRKKKWGGRKEGGRRRGGGPRRGEAAAAATPDTYRGGAWWGPARPAGSLGRDYYHLYRPLRASSWTVGSARARGTRAASPTTRARPIPPVPRSPALIRAPLPGCLGYYGLGPKPDARKTGTLWASAPFYIYIYMFDVIIISLSRNSTSVFRYSEQMEGEDFEIRETYNFWKHFLNKDFVENKSRGGHD